MMKIISVLFAVLSLLLGGWTTKVNSDGAEDSSPFKPLDPPMPENATTDFDTYNTWRYAWLDVHGGGPCGDGGTCRPVCSENEDMMWIKGCGPVKSVCCEPKVEDYEAKLSARHEMMRKWSLPSCKTRWGNGTCRTDKWGCLPEEQEYGWESNCAFLESCCLLKSVRDEGHQPWIETCSPDDFQCSNGDCLYKHVVCDGEENCPDGADEADCEQLIPDPGLCSPLDGFFKVPGSDVCYKILEKVICGFANAVKLCKSQNLKIADEPKDSKALYKSILDTYGVKGERPYWLGARDRNGSGTFTWIQSGNQIPHEMEGGGAPLHIFKDDCLAMGVHYSTLEEERFVPFHRVPCSVNYCQPTLCQVPDESQQK